MKNLNLAIRGVMLAAIVIYGVVLSTALGLLKPFSERYRQALLQPFARHFFRLVQRVMGVRLRNVGRQASGAVLIASNHVSWLDIIVLGSSIGACFVSKSEVASWPVVGWLARQGGTLFIHRGRHDSAEHIAHEMTWRLKQGQRLLFFPEGTTTDGRGVKRFKHRLFQPALHVASNIQPVAIAYKFQGDDDPVAYVDNVSFMSSILGVLGRGHTEVTISWCETFPARGDRRELAARAEAEVAAALSEQQAA